MKVYGTEKTRVVDYQKAEKRYNRQARNAIHTE
jgi:hypothetical protein